MSTPLQLNTGNRTLATPVTYQNQKNLVTIEDSLRPVTTFGPKKYYSEDSYPQLNQVYGAVVRPPPMPPTSSRADIRNNNLNN